MQRILPFFAFSVLAFLAGSDRSSAEITIRGVPNTAEAARAPGALATAASGLTNSAWPPSPVSAAIVKSTRCIGDHYPG
jgi:hypothetical protein